MDTNKQKPLLALLAEQGRSHHSAWEFVKNGTFVVCLLRLTCILICHLLQLSPLPFIPNYKPVFIDELNEMVANLLEELIS